MQEEFKKWLSDNSKKWVEFTNEFKLIKLIGNEENIELGKNDVLIGTHSLLNKDIYLINIGLLIVDEEHRFGVRQKEKVKHYKKNIDVRDIDGDDPMADVNIDLKDGLLDFSNSDGSILFNKYTEFQFFKYKTVL